MDSSFLRRCPAEELTGSKATKALNLLVNRRQECLQNGFQFVA